MHPQRPYSFIFLVLGVIAALGVGTRSSAAGTVQDEDSVGSLLSRLNDQIAARGLNVRISKAEWVTLDAHNAAGQTVFANDRSKILDSQWVPADPRRGSRTNITYLVDQSDGAANPSLTNAQTEAAIDRAFATWAGVSCTTLQIQKVADPGYDPDIIDGLFGFGTVGTPFAADIVDAGWMPGAFFDAVFPGGSGFILATTFTLSFLDLPSGDDINHDGKLDTAFCETYYNNAFPWAIDTAIPPVDVETVALHETGHGLGHDHFGKVFETDSNGKLHTSPFAVMNAVITQEVHTLEASDTGAHCSIWANWPH